MYVGERTGVGTSTFEVETDTEFPSVVDLIKSGLGTEHTFDMIDGLVAEGSQTIH